jgi:hypothetical protein
MTPVIASGAVQVSLHRRDSDLAPEIYVRYLCQTGLWSKT